MPMNVWGLSVGVNPKKDEANPKVESDGKNDAVVSDRLPPLAQNLSSSPSVHSALNAGVQTLSHEQRSSGQDFIINNSNSKSRNEIVDEWAAASSVSSFERSRRIRQRVHHSVVPSSSTTMTVDEESQTNSSSQQGSEHMNSDATISPRGIRKRESSHQQQQKQKHRSGPLGIFPFVSRVQYRNLTCLFLRSCVDPKSWQIAWYWAKRNRKLVYCILFCIPFILRPSRLWKWRYSYFGKHNNHGGEVGQRIEKWGNLRIFDKVQAQQQKQLDSLGIVLPDSIFPTDRKSFRVLNIDYQAAIRELLVRREQRAQMLLKQENQANASFYACTPSTAISSTQQDSKSLLSSNSFKGTVVESRTEEAKEVSCSIPLSLFVPDVEFSWQTPRPGKSKWYQHLLFNELEMRQLIADTRPELVPLFDLLSRANDIDRIHLWAVCSIFHFGGIFVGDMHHSDSKTVERLAWDAHNPIMRKQDGQPLALMVVDKFQRIQLMAATPRHPALLCILNQWESMFKGKHGDTLSVDGDGFERFDRLVTDSFLPLPHDHSSWTKASLNLSGFWDLYRHQNWHIDTSTLPTICNFHTEYLTKISDPSKLNGVTVRPSADTYLLEVEGVQVNHEQIQQSINVEIVEGKSDYPAKKTEKVSLEFQLKEKGLEPGWFCMRCIKIPGYGRMERCTQFCPNGYTDLVCNGPDIPEKHVVHTQVILHGFGSDYQSGTAIPKIIHQTWFEEVTLDRYPQLARLQKSWKNTGWKYQLYTDATARAYIVEHFPSRFADAFDALIPGAFKADLFRYLVLMREGGIYADVDILLETNLDNLLTPSLSFFAPRDVVAEFAGEPFCLWNGLIGASPGHPFIVRAVERLVNLILDRADVFDMERDICRSSKDPLEMWKIRLHTLLLLSGPCGLGVAVNEALGKASLEKIDTGWIGLDELEFGQKKDHGDALIMVVDKHDIGGFRISDPERSTIVASTDMIGVEKNARELSNPIEAEQKRQQKRRKKDLSHYSTSNKGVFVWGSSGVYVDKIVTHERIKLQAYYKSSTQNEE